MKFIVLYSNCCFARVIGETYRSEDGVVSGRCSRCKEGAVFYTEKQLRNEEDIHSNNDFDNDERE